MPKVRPTDRALRLRRDSKGITKNNDLGKELKKRLACGGTVKNGVIELQGDHREKAKEILIKMGYKEELLDA